MCIRDSVHTAPAFGEDDANVGRKYNLPFVQLVDSKGDMAPETPFAGKFVKDADPLVLKDLEERGLLFAAPAFEHSYPDVYKRQPSALCVKVSADFGSGDGGIYLYLHQPPLPAEIQMCIRDSLCICAGTIRPGWRCPSMSR